MAQDRSKNRQQLTDETRRTAACYMKVFGSPDGQTVMNHLNLIFRSRNMVGTSEFETITRAAQADVIHQIEMMIQVARDEVVEAAGGNA